MSNKLRNIKRNAPVDAVNQPGITLTIFELRKSMGALNELCSKQIPAALAFKLAKSIKIINQDIETFETTRISICQRLGTAPTAERGEYTFTPEARIEFDREIDALIATEVTLPISKIKVEDLGAAVTLTAGEASGLLWLFE
jgi:hypothetical protein